MRPRKWTLLAAFLWTCLLWVSWVANLEAQTSARLYRPMIDLPFYTSGVQDGYYQAGARMNYPRNRGGSGSYGTVRITSMGSENWNAFEFSVRQGHGVWTLTSDARVVYTGVRDNMQANHIAPMHYQVDEDPDFATLGKGGEGNYYIHRRPTAKMGYGSRNADGFVETNLGGNWYPGSELMDDMADKGPEEKVPVHINNFFFSDYTTRDEWAEEIIVTKWTNSQGLTFTERASGWSHPDFDDLFIDELVIENTGDTDGDGEADIPVVLQNDLYVGFQDRFNNSASGQQWARYYWRDDMDFCMDDRYAWDSGSKLLYNWDGDHPLFNDWDDTGDPYKDSFAYGSLQRGGKINQGENAMMSPCHLGVGVIAYTDDPTSPYRFNALDAGEGYVAPDGDQPFALRYWGSYTMVTQDDPQIAEMSEQQIYSEVVGGGRTIEADPDQPSGQFSMLLFGPYDLPPNGKAKIVLAYLAGHPGQVLGNTDAWTWARADKDLPQKQGELAKGLDALKQNLAAAQFAYDNAFDIPDCPPDLNFVTGSSATANMKINWSLDIESASHPDYGGAGDIAGYRIYRSTWFDCGPWELIADFPVGTSTLQGPTYRVSREGSDYVFEDLSSAAGFFYHYSARAYSTPHATWTAGSSDPTTHPLTMADLPGHIATHVQVGQEGGWSAATQRTYADESPFSVPNAETEALNQKVVVVPNPFYLDSSHMYPGSSKLRFVGIPTKCRIRVFSVSGELVSDVYHNDPVKGEADYDQITWVYNGEIATGAYYWVVENLIEGANKGKLQKGGLVVIR